MSNWNTAPRYTAAQIARLHDEAHDRAQALRAEAMDNFWRGVGDAVVASGRAAARLAHRLQRHASERASHTLPASPRTPTVEA